MREISISALKDKALDVDADLRFMALEDLKKYLKNNTNIKYKSVESFVPILFRLLNDSNSNVQSQAVSMFSIIVRYMSPDGIIEMIEGLYKELLDENAKKEDLKITISIPSMALRLVLASGSFFSKQLHRNILKYLIPNITSHDFNVDSVELLIDLLKSSGRFLKPEEGWKLIERSVQTIFRHEDLIGRRSVVAFGLLLQGEEANFVTISLITQCMHLIIQESSSSLGSSRASINRLNLFSILLHAQSHVSAESEEASQGLTSTIFQNVKEDLKLSKLNDTSNVEDIDFDDLMKDNCIREEALNTVNVLITSVPYSVVKLYVSDIIYFIKEFISYDPLGLGDSAEVESSEDSDIEFSDDEDHISLNDVQDDDDGIWKLRLKSIGLCNSLALASPDALLLVCDQLLPCLLKTLDSSNDLIIEETIKTFINIISQLSRISNSNTNRMRRRNSEASSMSISDPYNDWLNQLCSKLEERIVDVLFVAAKISKFSITLKLVDSLVQTKAYVSNEFLDNVFSIIEKVDFRTAGNADCLFFYRTILDNDKISGSSSAFIHRILEDLLSSLNNNKTYHYVILETIDISRLFFKKIGDLNVDATLNGSINDLIQSIISLCVDKSYLASLKQKAIGGLTSACVHLDLDESTKERIFDVFRRALGDEVTMRITIESLIGVYSRTSKCFGTFINNSEFVDFLIRHLRIILCSTEESYYYVSLKLIDEILKCGTTDKIDKKEIDKLFDICVGLYRVTFDPRIMVLSFDILGNLIEYHPIDENFIKDLSMNVINNKLVDIEEWDTTSYLRFIRILLNSSSFNLAEVFARYLDLKSFISAKTMAIIYTELNMKEQTKIIESELISYIENKRDMELDDLLFHIQFLGNIGSAGRLNHVNIDTFLYLLDSHHESVRFASSRAIGLLVERDLASNLQRLLNSYVLNEKERSLNIISLIQILGDKVNIEALSLNLIWNTVWTTVSLYGEEFSRHGSEIKYAGDVLSKICLRDNAFICITLENAKSCHNRSTAYVSITILKQLMSKLATSLNDLLELFQECLKFLEIPCIEIKQALVDTISTGLHNKPRLLMDFLAPKILPLIFEELPPRPEFKKVIPMGPYKYVIDQGLEIRKLCYELLYTVISMDPQSLKDHNVDIIRIGRTIIDKGLTDTEIDIVILSSINLGHLISSDYKFFLTSPDVLPSLMDALRLNLSKKLKSKASTQEAESFNEGLKAVVKLSKIINKALLNQELVNNSWIIYYSEMKANFALTFAAVEI